ncbi:MAG TPA: manganese catalase family protein [Gemmatimonadaceae bacterium]|nr:manganese catalase family protein [Gemmatimonadaceae bacterium]
MPTLMTCTFQSFNVRGRTQMRPFHDLIANIAAEELGHIEAVSYTINLLHNCFLECGARDARLPAGSRRRRQAAPRWEISRIWTGKHPEDGSALRVEDGPPTGSTPPALPPEPPLTAPLGPDIDTEMFRDTARKLVGSTAGAPA